MIGIFCLYYDSALRYNRNPLSFTYNTQGPGFKIGALFCFMVQPVSVVLADVAYCAAGRNLWLMWQL
ncbi:hypothetical protein FHS10_000884 [Mucilaginibacter dorajii]|nr:hypothetical protein [Mucilaginibacter dorajii]